MTLRKRCPICQCELGKSETHYGGICCGGCQAFFRRMTRKNRICNYACFQSFGCQLSRGWRSCKICRYQKCIGNGMDPNLVSQPVGFSPVFDAIQNVDKIEKCIQNIF